MYHGFIECNEKSVTPPSSPPLRLMNISTSYTEADGCVGVCGWGVGVGVNN